MKLRTALIGLASLLYVCSALAGPKTDAFGECLSDNTSGKDRKVMVRWVVLMIETHPALSDLAAKEGPGERDDVDRQMAELVNRLLTKDCAQEGRAAIQADGSIAIQAAFQTVGATAMRELMGAPEVTNSMQGYIKYLDKDKLRAALGLQ